MPLSPLRQEYRPWTGVRPAKSARKNPPAPYASPGNKATHLPPETSYQAAYSGEVHRSIGLHQADHIPSTIANIQPTSVPQPIPAPIPATAAPSPCSLQHSSLPERTDLSLRTKGEVSVDSTMTLAVEELAFLCKPDIFHPFVFHVVSHTDLH